MPDVSQFAGAAGGLMAATPYGAAAGAAMDLAKSAMGGGSSATSGDAKSSNDSRLSAANVFSQGINFYSPSGKNTSGAGATTDLSGDSSAGTEAGGKTGAFGLPIPVVIIGGIALVAALGLTAFLILRKK